MDSSWLDRNTLGARGLDPARDGASTAESEPILRRGAGVEGRGAGNAVARGSRRRGRRPVASRHRAETEILALSVGVIVAPAVVLRLVPLVVPLVLLLVLLLVVALVAPWIEPAPAYPDLTEPPPCGLVLACQENAMHPPRLASRNTPIPLLLVLSALLLPAGASAARKPQRSAPIEARLELAAGLVTLDGREVVYSGAALPTGTRLATGPGARALARLSDGAAIFLGSATSVALLPDRVQIEEGECWLDTPPRIRDDSSYQLGDVVVTATEAGLDLGLVDGVATIYVARGLAVVSAPAGRVEVRAGELARVGADGKPQLEPVTWWQDWTGGMADNRMASEFAGAGAGVLYGVDPASQDGSPARDLDVARMAVGIVIRDGLAETEVDQTFANPSSRDLEGWYWFTVPVGASVTSFAVEQQGQMVQGEFVERQEAKAAYGDAMASGEAPAILEWVDGRSFRARIFPVPAMGTRRVIVRYLEQLDITGGVMRFVYPMQSVRPTRIGEFSLSVDLGREGKKMDISTLADATIEDGGSRVTMRRSGYTPLADFQLEATVAQQPHPLRVSRFASGGETADYLMIRYSPDVDWDVRERRRADVVVVVDTSAGGDPESRALKTATAEAVLRALSTEDRFALVSLDVQAEVLHPAQGLAQAEPASIAIALERLAEHSSGGATDLAGFFGTALSRLHDGEQPAIVYVGDGLATSGELTGDQLRERLRRTLSTSRARLFAVAVGSEANVALLEELARTGGGMALRVEHADEATARALRLASALKTPTITGLQIDAGAGLDDVLVSGGGKVSHGSEVTLLARTHHPLPQSIRVTGRLGGKDFERTYKVPSQDPVAAPFVPRLWAQEQVRRRLGSAADEEDARSDVLRFGLDYGLMTPFSSILVLDSPGAYAARGIAVGCSPLRGVRLADAASAGRAGVSAGACGSLAVDDVAAAPVARKLVETITPPSPPRAASSRSAPAAPERSQSWEREEALALETASGGWDEDVSSLGDSLGAAGGTYKQGGGGYASTGGLSAGAPADISGIGQGAGGSRGDKRSDSGRSRESRRGGDDRPSAPAPEPAVEVPAPQPVQRITWVAACSDWAQRPLRDRSVVWKRRLQGALPEELIDRYRSARAACELPDWRSEATFLRLLAARVDGEGLAVAVLRAFDDAPDTQRYVARLVLRGSADPHLVAAVESVLFGKRIDWPRVDLELSAIKDLDERIERLRQVMATAPEDSRGSIRLVRLLSRADRLEELVVQSRRLREQGIMTPLLARELGDVLSSRGMDTEAIRAYSEIVEFNPASMDTRRLLGDIYLSHAWYEQAYREYASIDSMSPERPDILLRMATAAAGQGRVDEALRTERRVASAPGNPGPQDPRRWARLLSAARIAVLLGTEADEGLRDGMRRRLKELEHFRAPGTLVLLTWEDLTASFDLGVERDGRAIVLGDPVDASPVGLSSVMLPPTAPGSLTLTTRLRGTPQERPIVLTVHTITWDGSAFQVASQRRELAAATGSTKL